MLARVEEIYAGLANQSLEENAVVDRLYEQWLGGKGSDKAQALLHTEYHAVEKMNNALNIKW